jgi:hypothetical protein
VAGIGGPTVNSDLRMETAFFDLLFRAVMMMLAQRLQFTKPEQVLIFFVRDDMITNFSECMISVFQAKNAKRVILEMRLRPTFPRGLSVPTITEGSFKRAKPSKHRYSSPTFSRKT